MELNELTTHTFLKVKNSKWGLRIHTDKGHYELKDENKDGSYNCTNINIISRKAFDEGLQK